MPIAQPTAGDYLNSPDHSALHRIIAADPAAAIKSIQVSTTQTIVSAPVDGIASIQFNKADLITNVLNIDTTNSRVGIGTTSSSFDFSFGGNSARTLALERHTTANTAGNNFTLKAGGATSGATDKAGGNLILAPGISTGQNTSYIDLQSSPKASTGALATYVVDPTGDGGFIVNETATDGNATVRVDSIDGAGVPTAVTVTIGGSGYTLVDFPVMVSGAKSIYPLTYTLTGTADNSPVTRLRVHGAGSVELNPSLGTGILDSPLILNSLPSDAYFIRGYSPLNTLTEFSVDKTAVVTARVLSLTSNDPALGTLMSIKNGYFALINANSVSLANIDIDGAFRSMSNISSPQGGFGIYSNNVFFSQQIDSYKWTKTNATVVANSYTAPNNTVTMDKVTSSGNGSVMQSIVAPETGTMFISAFVYALTDIVGSLGFTGGASGGSSFAAGTTTQRVVASFPVTSGTTYNVGVNNIASGDVGIWGFQAEMGSSVGPYVRTANNTLPTSTNGLVLGSTANVYEGNNGFGVTQPLYPVDVFGTLNGSIIPAPASPLVSRTAGGSVTAGSHSWKVTFTSAYGETTPSAKSNVISTSGTAKTFTVNLPLGATGTTGRKIWRTVAGDTGNWKLVDTVADNTTLTYSDSIADGSLGADAPTTNTTAILTVATGGVTAMTIDPNQKSIFTGTITAPSFIGGVQNLSGAGAANVTQQVTAITTTGVANAISLADGISGQTKTIFHDVDGGSFVLTPTTKTGWTTFTSTVVGESITLLFTTTRGWIVTGSYLGAIA